MKSTNEMPRSKVFANASRMLDRLATILAYQAEKFSSESIDEFSELRQEEFERIAAMLSDASSCCDKAFSQIERVREILK